MLVHFTFASDLEELAAEKEVKQRELDGLSETAELYEYAVVEHARQQYLRENHPKELFPDHNTGRLYDYLVNLNRGISFTELNYSFRDSTINNDHGIVNVRVSGEGAYRNLYNFIYRIEHSRPILHIKSLQLQNIDELDKLSRVTFEMHLGAYYNRVDREDYVATLADVEAPGNIGYNPWFPLVHTVPPNEDDLVNVENSRMMGMTSRFILIRDQNNQIQRLTVGDQVYLGRLQEINTDRQSAVFRLNRGGLVDRVVLSLD